MEILRVDRVAIARTWAMDGSITVEMTVRTQPRGSGLRRETYERLSRAEADDVVEMLVEHGPQLGDGVYEEQQDWLLRQAPLW